MKCATVASLAITCAALAERFEFAEVHMAVPVRVVLHAKDEAQARRAAREAFDRVKAWDDVLTDWREDSDAMRLPKQAGASAETDGRLAIALDVADRFARSTHGALDPAIGRLTRLWRQARRTGARPDPTGLAAARASCGRDAWKWDAGTRRFTALRDGVRMDFGAIGQGLAADEALAALRAAGCPASLVDVSGDIALGAPPPGEPGWRIRVEPEFDAQPADDLLLHDCGVSTSGDRGQRARVGDRVVSHIIDPATGEPLPMPRQATVVARDATTADALATALCVLDAPAAATLACASGVHARLDRTPADGGVQRLEGWSTLRRASSSRESGPSAPEAPRPSPASEASGPPCSPARPSR